MGTTVCTHVVQVDAFNVQAHQVLLRLLLADGHLEEAERRFTHVARQFREVRAPEADALERAWTTLRAQAGPALRGAVPALSAPPSPAEKAPQEERSAATVDAGPTPFVGRAAPLERIYGVLDGARADGDRAAVLVTAEPGGGKSRLLERVRTEALNRGLEVLSSRAFDVERGRPFGPWLDALGVLSDDLVESAQARAAARCSSTS